MLAISYRLACFLLKHAFLSEIQHRQREFICRFQIEFCRSQSLLAHLPKQGLPNRISQSSEYRITVFLFPLCVNYIFLFLFFFSLLSSFHTFSHSRIFFSLTMLVIWCALLSHYVIIPKHATQTIATYNHALRSARFGRQLNWQE
jgi:hypothetical protein